MNPAIEISTQAKRFIKSKLLKSSAKTSIWLISGRSPLAIAVGHILSYKTTDEYEEVKGDQADKTIVEMPSIAKFPRQMRQYWIGNMQVFHTEAKDDSKPIVLYIHGGAYVLNFTAMHWTTMARWARMTGCGIVAPNYPLLYQHTAGDAHPLMMQLYQQLIEQYPAQRIIIMGDSAGGGFGLALAQAIRDKGLELPKRLVLISPWVDVLGGDDSIQEHDTFLNAEVLRLVGTDWAKGMDPRNPMISPLYGDMHGLPPVDLFTGTWEIFYTDIANCHNKMKAAGVEANLHIAKKMGHVYPLWPCPEGAQARKEIDMIIKQ